MTAVGGTAALTPDPRDDEAARKAAYDAEFDAFTEATYHTAERILRARWRNRDWVQDALQEAYIHGRAKWPKIREYVEPIGWVITTARNKLLKENTRHQREIAVPPEELSPAPQPDLADAWEAQELLRCWLQLLPARQAEVFQMSREGFSNKDIARILGIADISVRSYKAAARRQLRQLAEEAGYTESDSRRPRGGDHGSR